jgi:hypothetical protein
MFSNGALSAHQHQQTTSHISGTMHLVSEPIG